MYTMGNYKKAWARAYDSFLLDRQTDTHIPAHFYQPTTTPAPSNTNCFIRLVHLFLARGPPFCPTTLDNPCDRMPAPSPSSLPHHGNIELLQPTKESLPPSPL
jgi:hypothetical protein